MARPPAETTGGDEPAFRPSGGLCPRPPDLRHLGAGLPGGNDQARPPMRPCIPAAVAWAAGATCSPMTRVLHRCATGIPAETGCGGNGACTAPDIHQTRPYHR